MTHIRLAAHLDSCSNQATDNLFRVFANRYRACVRAERKTRQTATKQSAVDTNQRQDANDLLVVDGTKVVV
jgi:hypothetical protein